MTTAEVAQTLGWTVDRTRRWARLGLIPGAIAIGEGRGRTYIFARSAIIAFAAERAGTQDSYDKDLKSS